MDEPLVIYSFWLILSFFYCLIEQEGYIIRLMPNIKRKKPYFKRAKRKYVSATKFAGISTRLTRKVKSSIIKSSYIVVGVVFLISFVSFFLLLRYYKNPLADAGLGSLSTKTFDQRTDYNLLSLMLEDKDIKNSKILEINLLMFRPSQKKVYVLEIEPTDKIFAKGVGYDSVSNLYALSNMKEDNLDLLVLVLEAYISQPVDGYIITDTKNLANLKVKFSKEFEFSNVKSYPNKFAVIGNVNLIKTSVTSNLSALEVYYMLDYTAGLGDTSVITNKFESDANIDKDIFKSEVLSTEKQLIVILNATSAPGLASDYARVLKTQGGEILSIGNSEQKNDSSIIYYHKFTDSVELISQNLHISDVRGVTPQNIEDEPIMDRADIIIILGKDKVIEW